MTLATETLPHDAQGIARASTLLRGGNLVAFPTETVYGLGADAGNDRAVAAIFAAKGRPQFNPLIVHVTNADAARQLVEWSDTAAQLAAAFWPGALTLVLPLRAGHGLSPLVTAGLGTVGLRVPANDAAQAVLKAAGLPIAAPSANPSGRISPTTAQHVLAGLSGQIAAVLDGGVCPVGLESTIVGLDGETPTLLRAGGIPAEAIENALGTRLGQTATDKITAPGQMTSHYAPRARVRLNARVPHPGEVHLGFGTIPGDITLSATGDLTEAAANLFNCLHLLDAQECPIAVAPIPLTGLGAAINDRLRRAAAPR